MRAVFIIKELCSVILAASIFMGVPAYAAENPPKISAEKAVLMHEDGETVFEKNADRRSLIVSTTKIMTAIVVIENCSLNEKVKIRPEYCGIEGSSMYLESGSEYSVEELLEGLMLVSGNDAAEALACHCAGSGEKFAELMNCKARELDMKNSHFENPHGLDSKEHYSTAEDMAKLMAYCMKNKEFRRITALRTAEAGGKKLFNHNKLLKLCRGCTGGKTGYTMAAGRCLVSCCRRGQTMLICVTLADRDDWNDHIKLYNWAFDNYSKRNLSKDIFYEIPVVSGEHEKCLLYAEKFEDFLPLDAKISVRAELPFFVFAPVRAGERAGKIKIYSDGKLLGEAGLYCRSSIRAAA